MHNFGVHLGTRQETGGGRTRIVVWADGSQSDLGVVLAAAAAGAPCVGSVVVAAQGHGVPRELAIGLAALSGVYAALILVPLFVVRFGIYLGKGLVRAPASTTQRVSWVIVAVLVGAMLGTDVYGAGMPGLLTGPILFALVVIGLGAAPRMSTRARHRVLALSLVPAVSALLIGLTIFV